MSSPTPKSCLKRSSIPSNTPHPFFEDRGRCASPENDASSISSTSSAPHEPHAPPKHTPENAQQGHRVPRRRPKSVSFSEDDDVWVYKPFNDPLHKQAAKQVVRLFRACADALKMEPPDASPMSRHNLIASYSGCVGGEER
ncbi:hypothetical protein BC628DRAFT_570264 [Trametes gibbosa]|nr:hypothetical protein BC628DRAFT_570264 [Trametes gibbosa]